MDMLTAAPLILVVEDDDVDWLALERTCRTVQRGWPADMPQCVIRRVGSAEDAAAERAEGLEPDLLAVDHRLPGMSGAQLAGLVEWSPGWRLPDGDPPIVWRYSGSPEGLRAGDQVVQKPPRAGQVERMLLAGVCRWQTRMARRDAAGKAL